MSIQEELIQNFPDEEFVLFEGLDDAILGVSCSFSEPLRVIYDYDKCIHIFMRQGMSREEAHEWMEFNVTGAYVGDKTPAFLYRVEV